MKIKWVVVANIVLIVALATIGASAQGTNLVANGDFETPVVTNPAQWDIYPSGTPGLGWTVEWTEAFPGAPAVANLELHRGVAGWLSYSGEQHTELDSDWDGPGGAINGEPATVRIYQDLPTCPGGLYQLQYAWSPRPQHLENGMEVWWDGQKIATHSASGVGNANTDWTLETFQLNATGDTTRLAFVALGPAHAQGMFLDDVSVLEIACKVPVDVHVQPACCSEPDGTTEVVIMGSADLDVTQIDVSTLTFAGNGSPQCAVEEVSGDAYPDLVCQFSSTFKLTGKLQDGVPIEGDAKICCP
jgi:hypothetical protein